MTALLLAVGVAVLAAVVLVMFPVGAAGDEKARAQTAADAAALAGLEEVRELWVNELTAPEVLEYPDDPGEELIIASGASNAATYATRNGAQLLTYLFIPTTGQAYVEVELSSAQYPDSGSAFATAKAEFDLDASACEWGEPEDVTPPAVEGGPRSFTGLLTCGEWEAGYEIEEGPLSPDEDPATAPTDPEEGPESTLTGVTVDYAEGYTAEELFDALEPRLVE